ncbi:MAG TPA: hypothetical protein VGK00_06285, partial [Anaerolineales bacterium]
IIIMCTDGLTDLVGDGEILNLVHGRTLKQSTEAMINLACERGGHDNITVVMLGVPWEDQNPGPVWLPG